MALRLCAPLAVAATMLAIAAAAAGCSSIQLDSPMSKQQPQIQKQSSGKGLRQARKSQGKKKVTPELGSSVALSDTPQQRTGEAIKNFFGMFVP